jgi:hypothetical protein
MYSENSARIFHQLILDKAEEHHGIVDDEELANWLLKNEILNSAHIVELIEESLLSLEAQECTPLAEAFFLEERVLQTLLCPTSLEVIHHTLMTVVSEQNMSEGCEQCQMIALDVDDLEITSSKEELERVALDMLDHLIERYDEEFDELTQQLFSSISNLDRPAKLRLLAAVYEEQARHETGAHESVLSALARFRGDFLSPLARKAFDHLAQTNDGLASRAQLREALEVSETTIGSLDRAFQGAWRLFIVAEGTSVLETAPVVKGRQGQFKIQASFLPEARWVVKAETTAAASD